MIAHKDGVNLRPWLASLSVDMKEVSPSMFNAASLAGLRLKLRVAEMDGTGVGGAGDAARFVHSVEQDER
jgi:hypothetical protein